MFPAFKQVQPRGEVGASHTRALGQGLCGCRFCFFISHQAHGSVRMVLHEFALEHAGSVI
jgi:hypothetical protein